MCVNIFIIILHTSSLTRNSAYIKNKTVKRFLKKLSIINLRM